jgi:hypothetical protein
LEPLNGLIQGGHSMVCAVIGAEMITILICFGCNQSYPMATA